MIACLLIEIAFVVGFALLGLYLIGALIGQGAVGSTAKSVSEGDRKRWNILTWFERRMQNRVVQDANGFRGKLVAVLRLSEAVAGFVLLIVMAFVAVLIFEFCIVTDVMVVRDDFKAEKDRCIDSYTYTEQGCSHRVDVAWGTDCVVNASSHPVVVYDVLYGENEDRPLRSCSIASGKSQELWQSDFMASPRLPKQLQRSNDAETTTHAADHELRQAWWYADVRPTRSEYYDTEEPAFDVRNHGWETLKLTRQAWTPAFREEK